MTEPTWVLEGDIFFEPRVLQKQGGGDVDWFVDSSVRDLDGAYLRVNADGRADELAIMRDLSKLEPEQSKSIGILRLTPQGAETLGQWLDEGIAAGRRNDYFDLILGDQLPNDHIRAVDVAGVRWFEIDTPQDLARAEKLFLYS